MTSLTKEQIQNLVGLIASTESNQISCDECFGQIAEYAEAELANRTLSEAMMIVQRHLEQCPCCNDEYEALLDAMREIDDQQA